MFHSFHCLSFVPLFALFIFNIWSARTAKFTWPQILFFHLSIHFLLLITRSVLLTRIIIIIINIMIIMVILLMRESFTQALADGLSLEFEWQ